MRQSEVTIPRLFEKNAGYATCMGGSGTAMENSIPAGNSQPNDAGFDHWFADPEQCQPIP